MVVMGLWGCQEGEVVAAVSQCGGDIPQNPVHPRRGQVRPNQSWSQDVAPQDHHGLFHRVAVEGGHGAWGSPVMVHLVNVLEEERMMKESKGEMGGQFALEWISFPRSLPPSLPLSLPSHKYTLKHIHASPLFVLFGSSLHNL